MLDFWKKAVVPSLCGATSVNSQQSLFFSRRVLSDDLVSPLFSPLKEPSQINSADSSLLFLL